MRFVPLVVAMCLAVLSGPLLALAQAPAPRADDVVLVVAQRAAELVAHAGGRVIGLDGRPFAVLATGDADFIAVIEHAPAWFVADGRWIADICGVRI